MRSLLAILLVVVLAAGCTAEIETPLDTMGEQEALPLPDYKPIEPTEDVQLPTLDEPPRWKQGEWWQIKVDDLTGASTTTLRIVVGEEGGNFLVGMPSGEFSDDLMVLHLPGFGQVRKADLSFEIHDSPFQTLRFPLVQNDMWETFFEGRPVMAKVKSVDGLQAKIQLDGKSDHINVTYDAEVREIVRHEQPGYADYEVLDHGYDYTGLVTVPHQHDLVFQHGRIAGVLNPQLQPATSITDQVKVDSTYDRVSGVLLAGGLSLNGPVTGVFKEKATAPNGKVFELTAYPTDPGLKIVTFQLDQPGGMWTFEHIAAGAGFAAAEGIAYHTYDVEMPSGRIRASTGEHRHGDGP